MVEFVRLPGPAKHGTTYTDSLLVANSCSVKKGLSFRKPHRTSLKIFRSLIALAWLLIRMVLSCDPSDHDQLLVIPNWQYFSQMWSF